MTECQYSIAEAMGKDVREEAAEKDVPFSGSGYKIKQTEGKR